MVAATEKPSILVVEDEQVVSMFMLELLQEAGFEVRPESSGRSALRRIEQPNNLAAAIVDLGLPDMHGEELIGHIRQQCPRLPLVIATGYESQSYEDRYKQDSNLRVLSKPFDAPELLTALASLKVVNSPEGRIC